MQPDTEQDQSGPQAPITEPQPAMPPQEPGTPTSLSAEPINPLPFATPTFTNSVPPPNNKARKIKLFALFALAFAVIAGGAYYFLANNSADSNTSTKSESLEAIDESTGIHYKKIKNTDQVRVLGEKSYGGAVEGVLVYESVQGVVPSGTTVPTSCTYFNQSDFGRFDGGMVILHNMLKDNGAVYSSVQDIVDLYKAETPTETPATLIDISGTKVVRIDDGGDGLSESCTSGKKFKRVLDLTTTYVVLTKSGKEIMVALVRSDNTVDGVSVDTATRDKASKIFDEDDLRAQVEYIIASN